MVSIIGGFNYPDYMRYLLLQQGIMYLDNDFDGNQATYTAEIHTLLEQPGSQLHIWVTSNGGDVYASLALYDMIRGITQKEVVCTCYGLAASAAATIILQAAKVRRASTNCTFMLHEITGWIGDRVSKSAHEDAGKEMARLTDVICGILAGRMGKSKEEVETLFARKEIWMGANEAKAMGLVDEVI